MTSVACAAAYADRIALPEKPEPVQIVEQKAPYTVEILSKDGTLLPTYEHGGKYYVQGSVGARYVIRVTNPTDNRVEAVVSVDGLDVIDGESADFVGKRGYVVPAHGELRIEGWRVSTAQVAAFRFSSVGDSYAGRKGKARNVGVVGLVIFEEKEPPQVIVQERPPVRYDYDRDRQYDFDDVDIEGELAPGEARGGDAPAAEEPAAKPAPARGGYRGGGKLHAEKKSAAPTGGAADSPMRDERCCTQKNNRPGLGTEFGERRYSAVSWTRFERKNGKVPDAFVELRYNDTDGLRALGIELPNPVDYDEIRTRETADPFPATHFSAPPPVR